ncbi:hypothetical protein ACWCPF_13960 [Streptomyces sp. NPDC001858]
MRPSLNGLVTHAGSVGLIAGALLLVIGINWVGALRGCLRAVWEKEQDPGNPILLRLKDTGVLVGLGVCRGRGRDDPSNIRRSC